MSVSSCNLTVRAAAEAYLAHQRALGRGYAREERVLDGLIDFLIQSNYVDLDHPGFESWCNFEGHLGANGRRSRQFVIRNFCLYRRRNEPDCFVPDPNYFPRPQPCCIPVLVEPEQIGRMLALTNGLASVPVSPLRPAVLRLAIVLLYTSGLRRGEVIRLALQDVEPQAGVLRICESKFHKSRLIPLSSGGLKELHRYLSQRLIPSFDRRPSSPLLCNFAKGKLRSYTGTGLSQGIHALFDAAGVRDNDGRRPRIHDLRHSFALQALMRWYREGVDVQSRLPHLALYMGHVSIKSTAYYLRFVPSLAALASERFERRFGHLIEEERL